MPFELLSFAKGVILVKDESWMSPAFKEFSYYVDFAPSGTNESTESKKWDCIQVPSSRSLKENVNIFLVNEVTHCFF